jgi:hypothetical protein
MPKSENLSRHSSYRKSRLNCKIYIHNSTIRDSPRSERRIFSSFTKLINCEELVKSMIFLVKKENLETSTSFWKVQSTLMSTTKHTINWEAQFFIRKMKKHRKSSLSRQSLARTITVSLVSFWHAILVVMTCGLR